MTNETLKPLLIAEDDDADAKLTTLALKQQNIANEIIRIADGEEVLQYLRYEGKYANRPKIMPCVLLLDLKMPKLSGLEVLKAIRNDENLQFLPVVILTSSKEEQDLVDGYKLGANAYVVKPIDFQQFTAAIKELGTFWAVVNTNLSDR